MEKSFTEMTSRELFCVLTGERGVMAQMYLQNIIKEYLASYDGEADLVTMVRVIANREEHKK